jgi:hypothetical protein
MCESLNVPDLSRFFLILGESAFAAADIYPQISERAINCGGAGRNILAISSQLRQDIARII